ncbi:MAG TPA: hypothetical protein VGM26_08080 [Rhizomicrobium sp.]|jgi:hypothetical protein
MSSAPYYRVNKFVVPPKNRDAFLKIIERTHAVVRRQQGFVRDLVLEQQSGPGLFNFVTLIEFSGIEAVPQVTAALAALDEEAGVSRREAVDQLGVCSDMANYRSLAV